MIYSNEVGRALKQSISASDEVEKDKYHCITAIIFRGSGS